MFKSANSYATLKNFILSWISNASPQIIVAICLVLVALVGVADYLTGYELSFSIFYLVPIAIVSWYVGRGAGLSISFVSAVGWLNMNLLAGYQYTHGAIPFWNTGVRLGFYALVVYLLTTLRFHLDLEKTLIRVDTLTGALSRRSFEQEGQRLLSLALRNGYPITLAYIDVDNFKAVNDTWGHSEGDRLLRIIGETLNRSVRGHDLVARLGGDEFALLLPVTDQQGAGQVFQRIGGQLSEMIAHHKWPVTFSIGVFTFRKPPATIDQAINAADGLMYSAKKGGKNKILYQTVDTLEVRTSMG